MINHTLRSLVVLTLTLAFVGFGGCATSKKPVKAGTYQVDLKVWAVVNFGESLGNSSNNGCRLTTQDITNIVEQLKNNSAVYGVNTKFNWDGMISTFQANVPSRSYPIGAFINDISGDPPNWTQDMLNVYFIGSPDNNSIGATLGPDTYVATGDRIATPFVRIGDGGINGPASNPTVVRKRLTLEHEVSHYIGRFNIDASMIGDPSQFFGKTYGMGATQRVYDGGEHLQSSLYLMSAAPVYDTQRSLVIPGIERPPQDELGEVSQRIQAGRWNFPN